MFKTLIPAVVLAAVVAACAGTGSTPAPTAAPATLAPATVAPASTVATGPTVSVSSAGFLVGPNGLTLYHFDKDAAGTSNCQTSQCATNWPALALTLGGSITVGTGLTAADFSTLTRTDSAVQVMFKQVPLYFFAGDSKPGDKNGDGVGGIWHVATTSTVPPAASSAPSAPASAPATAPAGGGAVCYDAHYQVVPCPSASAAAGAPNVSVSSAGNLVASNGMTLYEYDKDTTPGSSACTGDCATNWPALTIAAGSSVTIGTGVDQTDFATFTRSDDSANQVTYYAKPLYNFAGDTAPGQTTGDGIGGIWHVAKPQ